MKIQLVTIGKPKLDFAKIGFEDYYNRLSRLHTIKLTQIADKYQDDETKIREAIKGTFVVVLEINGKQSTSIELSKLLEKWEIQANEVSFLIGGPDGLPRAIRDEADYQWSLGKLTLPHDLAMVTTAEALYRASMINAKLPYHR